MGVRIGDRIGDAADIHDAASRCAPTNAVQADAAALPLFLVFASVWSNCCLVA